MHLILTLLCLVFGHGVVGASVLSVDEALALVNDSERIEVEGWITVSFEDFNLCIRQFKPRNVCLWIELSESSNSIEERVENCRVEVEWFQKYHGSRVVLSGLLVKVPGGHLGTSTAKIVNPEVIKVITPGPGEDQEYIGNCYEFIEQFESSIYSKVFKFMPSASDALTRDR